ncbi:galactose oxidase-like domain-containing protein [Ramlibacter sp. WS9]|uniref:galactose oxidase-like domain-containing protein n=1 Tax=Ramlibacter sp. WS9 TaxID=1882741 RepID=UPI0011443D84|nr:galactose oxidase-like domain-containing protein [Ramlibacter sp. WS9]ROZ74340.1 DUF1929 domain-containing protein [Ramlibacter sp. WS9]
MNATRILGALLPALALAACLLPAAGSAQTDPAVVGQWAKLANLSIVPIHTHLLPDGKVFMWGGTVAAYSQADGNTQILWDPANPSAGTPAAKIGYDAFCTGHSFLPDGSLLVMGGHISDEVGLPNASRYFPATNTWTAAPDMNAGRWYGTATTLPNGDALVVSGEISHADGVNLLPQVYQTATNTWRDLTGAQLWQALYPMMFVAPNGKVIEVGPSTQTRYLDTSGTGAWTWIGERMAVWRDSGSAVMYDAGKILIVGGQDPPTSSAEVLDLNAATPAWKPTGSMKTLRRHLDATLLPDGTVLATGGTSGSGFEDLTKPVMAPELWNPSTGVWTTLAPATVPRMYHSTALLLPDGRVLSSGGNGHTEVEVFSPPYLFKGPRPVISSAPTAVAYGQRFAVQAASAAPIAKVTLIRLGSVTHSFDQNQRMNVLTFAAASGGVEVTAPANANLAPPGHYMLFVVDANGIPSVASVVQLGGTASPPPPAPAPALTSLSPNSTTAGSPGFTLTVDGTGFGATSRVRWNGVERVTTLVSATRLTATVLAADVSAAGTAQVTVANGETVSGALAFTVTAPTQSAPRLSVTRAGTASTRGTVTSQPAGISCGNTCTATFAGSSPTTVVLTATANGNAIFAGWTGQCSGTAKTCTLTMDANKSVTATFNRK